MKTIVALIDFSDVTTKILDHAHALAKAFSSHVHLIHVVPPEPLVVDFTIPTLPPVEHKMREQDLLALRDSLAARGANVTAQLFDGQLLGTLLEQIKLLNPDVVIMGSHGHGALYNLIVGSVMEDVISHARWPVLVVPSVTAPETTPEMTAP